MPNLGVGYANYLLNFRFKVLGVLGTIGVGIATSSINILLSVLYIFSPNILYFLNSINWINVSPNGKYANPYKNAID